MTFFPCPRSTVAIISTVEVLPLEPVTAMMWGGSCTRLKMSGQIFRANLPGIELPLPTSLPTNRPSLQTTIAKNFRMNILLSAFIFQPDHQRRQIGGADAGDPRRLSQIHRPHGGELLSRLQPQTLNGVVIQVRG